MGKQGYGTHENHEHGLERYWETGISMGLGQRDRHGHG